MRELSCTEGEKLALIGTLGGNQVYVSWVTGHTGGHDRLLPSLLPPTSGAAPPYPTLCSRPETSLADF